MAELTTGGQAAEAAINSGTAILASEGDVTAAFGPALQGLAALSLALPPPWSKIAAVSATAAIQGEKATRDYVARGMVNLGKYLPFDKAAKAIATISGGWGTSWAYAGKDKLVQYQRTDMPGGLELAFLAANAALGSGKLNVEEAGRFADYVYQVAKDKGATDWQAALAADETLYIGILAKGNAPPSAWAKHYNFVKLFGGWNTGEKWSDVAARLNKKAGLVPIGWQPGQSSAAGSGGTGGAIVAAIAAAALLLR